MRIFGVKRYFFFQLAAALDVMFGARCPSMFESETTKKSFESFEADSDTFSGTRVKDTEPFCGHYSLKNPWKIFRITEDQSGILLSQYKEVGFTIGSPKTRSVEGDLMVWPHPRDVIPYTRSSCYYDNMFIIYLFLILYDLF